MVSFSAHGQDSTWLAAPGSNAFNTGSNWTSGVPTGTATFDTSNTTNITVNGGQALDAFQFTAAAPAYTFTMTGTLIFNGSGITNDSSNTQTIGTNGQTLTFNNSAGINNNTTLNVDGSLAFFQNSSSASFTTINDSGSITFSDSSSSILNTISVAAGGFLLSFTDNSTIVNNLITVDSGSRAQFTGNASASGSNIIANDGASLLFSDNASARGSIVQANDSGFIDISGMATGISMGTIMGNGSLFLGATQLTVGDRDESSTFSGIIQDGGLSGGSGGSLVKIGTGTLTLTGANTYTGGTTITGGLINFNSAGNFGTGTITLNGGGLQWATATTTDISSQLAPLGAAGGTFDTNGNNVTLATGLTGVGGITKAGAGTLTLSGASTYGGATMVNAGTLQAGATNAFSAGSAVTVAAGATVALNNFSQTIGSLAGAGAVTLGSGTLTAGGDNTSTTFSGTISGSGGLTKAGTGMLTLTGANTYTGPTVINAGTLAMNGSLTSNTAVNAGATLQGTGTITGAVTVAGTIAPGNSIGTLNVVGAYTQAAGSTYTVEVNAAGQSDRINVTGAAQINGGTVAVQAASGSYARSTAYTILSATGGVTGTYSSVSSNFAFLRPSLSYGSNAVTLTLVSNTTSFQDGGQTPNQRAVGGALDLASPTATGDFANVLNVLYGLSTSQGAAALNMLGSQNYSGFASLMMQGSLLFMDKFQIQAGSSSGGGSASIRGGNTWQALKVDGADACDTTCDADSLQGPLWGAWGGGTGAFGTIAGDNNGNGFTYNLGGFIAGLDRKLAPNFRAGVAAGFNAASLYPQGGAPGNGTSNTLQFALYGSFSEAALYVDALAGYGHSDNRMSRQIIIPGLNQRTAQGYTTANTFFGQLETGYKLTVAPSIGGFVTPFARLQAVTSTQNGFSETSADSLNLTVAAQTTNSLRTVAGAQLGAAIESPWREKLNVTMRLGWSHEFADTSRPVNAAFAGAPAIGFTTFGAQGPRDGVVLGLGANTQVAERTSVYLRYDGDLAGSNTNHGLSAGVRYVW